jgi:anti-anti-sigma factor
LEQQFEKSRQQGAKTVFVDLADVSFMDSRGLEALIRGLRLLGPDNSPVQLVSPQTQPALLLDLTGFNKFFPVTYREPVSQETSRPQRKKKRLRSTQVSVAMPA